MYDIVFYALHSRRNEFFPDREKFRMSRATPEATGRRHRATARSVRLGGRQGDSKQNNNVLCTHFDGNFDGHPDAVVLYPADYITRIA